MQGHRIVCKCGHKTEMICIEWPPLVAVCTGCSIILGLAAYDPKNERTSYRRIDKDV